MSSHKFARVRGASQMNERFHTGPFLLLPLHSVYVVPSVLA